MSVSLFDFSASYRFEYFFRLLLLEVWLPLLLLGWTCGVYIRNCFIADKMEMEKIMYYSVDAFFFVLLVDAAVVSIFFFLLYVKPI